MCACRTAPLSPCNGAADHAANGKQRHGSRFGHYAGRHAEVVVVRLLRERGLARSQAYRREAVADATSARNVSHVENTVYIEVHRCGKNLGRKPVPANRSIGI